MYQITVTTWVNTKSAVYFLLVPTNRWPDAQEIMSGPHIRAARERYFSHQW